MVLLFVKIVCYYCYLHEKVDYVNGQITTRKLYFCLMVLLDSIGMCFIYIQFLRWISFWIFEFSRVFSLELILLAFFFITLPNFEIYVDDKLEGHCKIWSQWCIGYSCLNFENAYFSASGILIGFFQFFFFFFSFSFKRTK